MNCWGTGFSVTDCVFDNEQGTGEIFSSTLDELEGWGITVDVIGCVLS